MNGDSFSFEVTRQGMNGTTTTKYEGTVSGDTMHVKQTIDLGNGPQTVEVDAKRATP